MNPWLVVVVLLAGLPLLFLSKLRPGAVQQMDGQVHVSSGPTMINYISIVFLVAFGIVLFVVSQKRKK